MPVTLVRAGVNGPPRISHSFEVTFKYRPMIRLILGDITSLTVDAVVNAANTSLLGGGGVDGAIHRVAGPELLEACKKVGGCPTGEARITPGFRLPSKWVIHTVGPVWRGGEHDEAMLLESCYRQSFEVALANGVRSIAFPGISTGVYGYPKPAAAGIALTVMEGYNERFDEIVCCCFSEQDIEVYQAIQDGHDDE